MRATSPPDQAPGAGLVELSMPGATGPLRFTFAVESERDHITTLVRAHGLAAYEAPTPAKYRNLHLARGRGECRRPRLRV